MHRQLILSLFPGIDLFGRAFDEAGACVVRGPDPLWGQRVEDFHGLAEFDGIIAGTPCQDFSRARRCPPSGHGLHCLAEFARVVTECSPSWWLLENVPCVPDVTVRGYQVQRLNVSGQDCGCAQRRLRSFQFGYMAGPPLILHRSQYCINDPEPTCMASEGRRSTRRSWRDFVTAMGLPPNFDLPGWSVAMKYRCVGNGVPLQMGRVLAAAVLRRGDTASVRACVCGCGRALTGRGEQATAACRKRMERRRRVTAGVT